MSDVNNNKTCLPDYIDYGLKILSVGLNPSIPSAKLGFYFANPRNRFWKAFNKAEIIDTEIIPTRDIHTLLLKQYAIGFTDVAKRVSAMGHELRASDFKSDAPVLREKIQCYAPDLVWFHGKIAMNKFMYYAYGVKNNWKWGFNDVDIINSKVFISPNPSPANAAYSLDTLVDFYKKLRCG
ncbi:MAG: mismatch-specific DNA-glycosylase [Gammaproteobacteria bacterium]|nr:mismatch-specific DNA-glycosylase [Gammaproteobacteria bacterium]